MLWTLIVVLLLAWMVCVLLVNFTAPAIHLLLVAAVVMFALRFFRK